MLCISKVEPDASTEGDLLEWRLDLFKEIDVPTLALLRQKLSLPVIFTLRKKSQGGSFQGSEEDRLRLIVKLASLSPDYFDLEYDTSPEFIAQFARDFPSIKRIISYHNFEETPASLDSLLPRLCVHRGDLYKIACHACSTNDSLRLLLFSPPIPLIKICMGDKGHPTRILGKLRGSPWVYAAPSEEKKVVEGQLTIEELRSIYAIERPSVSFYGLIGDPVSSSVSHFTHNRAMRELNLDGIYIKMPLQKGELAQFFSLAKQLGIRGLSVTMPLKEEVLPFLDQIDDEAMQIGAVNTILFHDEKLLGKNTDGKGALDAIEKKKRVEGTKVIILGAGGAARAIVFEARKRGADVIVLNRTEAKARQLAKAFGVQGGSLELLNEIDYDILINTTPSPLPLSPEALKPNRIVMDIKTRPLMPPFLLHAKEKNCTLVHGYEMFVNQAVAQFEWWFSLDRDKLRAILKEEALKIIFNGNAAQQGINSDNAHQNREKESIAPART